MIFNKKNKSKPEIVRENRKLQILKIYYRSVWPLEDVLSDDSKVQNEANSVEFIFKF